MHGPPPPTPHQIPNWFFPKGDTYIYIYIYIHTYIYIYTEIHEKTQFATGCELVFFQWKRGLLLLRSRYSMGKHNGRELVSSMEKRFADSAKIMHDIWENTIRNWLRIGFFQWKRGLLLHEITIFHGKAQWSRIGFFHGKAVC